MTSSFSDNGSNRFLTAESVGPRDEQQDASIVLTAADPGTALLLVSDGVGGKSGGQMASQQVAKAARQLWQDRNGTFSDPHRDLETLCRLAHDRINAEGARHQISPRATIVALYLTPSLAYWVHSGDSRLYHFRGGRLVKRTEDHSLLQILLKQGLVQEDKMGEHPDQGLLVQALGGEHYKSPSQDSTEITPEDAFLLCTDGFWERTKIEEMAQILFESGTRAPSMLKRAVERAVTRNGPEGDNVSVAVALPGIERGSSTRVLRKERPTSHHPKRPGQILLIGGPILIALAVFGLFEVLYWARHDSGSVLPGPSPSASVSDSSPTPTAGGTAPQ